MDLSLSPDQTALQDAVARLYAKESHPERVREAESRGFDEALWTALVQMGLPTMGLPEDLGGAGASLTDVAVVAEQHGAHLGTAPFVETVVTARLLGRLAADGLARARLQRIVEGAPATLCVATAPSHASTVTVYAAAAEVVLVLRDGRVVAVEGPVGSARRTLSALAVAELDGVDGDVVAEVDPGGEPFARAVDEWRALTAVAQAGLADRALGLGVDYVKARHQFGVPIGSFQTIQHRLADCRTRADAARLLAYEAVWALDTGDPRASMLAAMASWFCGAVADECAGASLHFHGGYGFMLEYDIQLYVRRAKAVRLLLGDPRRELQEVARRRWASPARPAASHEPAARVGMDFGLDAETIEFQRQVRAFIAEHLTDEIVDRARTTGTMHDWGFHRALCERGYLAAGWPTEVGGLGRSAIEQTLLMQELYGAGAPVDGMGIAAMVGATLLVCGTAAQKAEVLPRILAGEVMCCLGYSEPDAGSDVAAVQTKAVRDGDDWVINGQKMFTTMAHEAHYVFLLARSNTAVPKHQGLTMFLVPMDTPGIEVTPVETMGGERTNITFYNDVRVDDRWRVGEVDQGWSVMHAALVYERSGSNWGEPDQLVESVARWALEGHDHRPFDDPFVRESLARAATELEAGRLLLLRTAWLSARGELPHVEGSMAKLHISETFARASSELLELCGASGLLAHGEPAAVLDGLVEHAFRHSVVTTIYGGSSEVQREIIANRGLGLPRRR